MQSRAANSSPPFRFAPIFTVVVVGVLFGCKSDDGAQKPDDPGLTTATATTNTAPRQFDGERIALERVFADPPLSGRPPMGVKISPDHKRLTFLRANEENSEITDLWAMTLPDGEAAPLVKTSDLVKADDIKLSEEERMAMERKRIRHRGITSYMWCGKGGDALLFPLSGDLYFVRLGEGAPEVKRLTSDGKAKLDPRCSSGGELVGFVQERELHIVDTKGGKPKKLTRGSTETKSHGLAEFVAQEEMGRYEGYWFSGDARYVAYLEVDESEVSLKKRAAIYADHTALVDQRYPAAGEKNARVTLRVLDLKTKKDVVVKTPAEDGYLPRVGFVADEKETKLAVQWQSRDQKTLRLLVGSAPQFTLSTTLEDKDDAWVELHDDFKALKGGRFLWTSEKSGARQIYVGVVGEDALKPLTHAPEPVVRIVGVEEDKSLVYYLRAEDRGRQQQLWRVTLDGSEAERVTTEPGWHTVGWGGGDIFVDTWSRFGQPAKVRLIDAAGEVRHVLDDNPATELLSFARPAPVWGTVEASDGTPLNALVLEPLGRREGERYPVIVYTYGGPTAQVVADRYGRLYPHFLYWTQRGYGVFLVDNRGTANRGRDFSRAFKDRFGQVEIEDQMRGVTAFLNELDWVDPARVGIFGWSYGGYVSALAILEEKTPFRAAAAVAPVTDWKLYDTHYTERYIGKPQDNAAAYASSEVTPKAKNLAEGERALLLVHGMADDNVLFSHTLGLVQALQSESVPFDLMVYPGRAHGLRGRETQLHVFRTINRFFDRELRPPE